MAHPDFLARFWQDIAGWALLAHLLMTIVTLCWVLHLKREPMSAIAWCLAVVMLPFGGPLSDTDHVIGHELVHAFQFDITTRPNSPPGENGNGGRT